MTGAQAHWHPLADAVIAVPVTRATRAAACCCSRFAYLRLSWVQPALGEAEDANDRAEDDRLHDRDCKSNRSPEEFGHSQHTLKWQPAAQVAPTGCRAIAQLTPGADAPCRA